ncbi:ferredoxin [Sporosarcina sp. PTS2304]|uniref:ferredoxin n=1 Tax=Sporosarcina sp. PTS2304 TaxID=2283194 RepID=UPI000E0D444F|nr:ferredoxin [Sporosarcina sp. PTS2304]AXH99030.1 ferredoxin [Sporosarcina sp. PTS2304]
MSKYSVVDQENCIACGACNSVAEEIFGYHEDGISFVKFGDNNGQIAIPKELEQDLEEAYEGCPSESILIQDCPFLTA